MYTSNTIVKLGNHKKKKTNKQTEVLWQQATTVLTITAQTASSSSKSDTTSIHTKYHKTKTVMTAVGASLEKKRRISINTQQVLKGE